MKKLLPILCLISFLNCEQIIENSIDNLIDNTNPNYDVFLKIENNSNYQLDNVQITSFSTIYINKLKPQKVAGTFGQYSVLENPDISFYINNNLYEYNGPDSSTIIESGNYILKINVLSTSPQSFNFELIEDTE